VRVDGPRAGTASIVINWRFTHTGELLVATLEHGALTSITGTTGQNTVTTVLADFEPGFPIVEPGH
jgi:alkyl sulfatase BDS1-like metallo-beta-lactamase superfamily hydrolase